MNIKPLVSSIQKTNLLKLVTLIAIIGLGLAVFAQWNTFVSTTVEWQKELHAMLANHIRAVSQDVIKYGGALVAISFGYGVFHAVGPGHGKAVIVTYLGTNKESLKKGIIISFTAAILQAFIAIVLVSVIARILKFKLAEVHHYGNEMALVSYILVAMLGVMLILGSISRLIKSRYTRTNKEHSHEHLDHSNSNHDHPHKHGHGSNCGCSHTHVPDQKESLWQTVTVILSMGFRPCSGAIVVLIYAHLVGVYSYGVLATLMMGVGTGLSVSLIAIVTLYARSWLERFVSETGNGQGHSYNYFSLYLRGIGGFVLIALGWSFYTAASVVAEGHPLF